MEFTKILKSFSQHLPSSQLIKKPSNPFTVMILSPHPDDESIMGSLPLRLLHENNAHIVNIAVTLGSKIERQGAREIELKSACELLEMECLFLAESWAKKAKELKSLIQKHQPDLILAPHIKDHHPTHIKTGELLKKVLTSTKLPATLICWTEYWGQMKKPNILVEVPMEILELQMRALALHVGEVSRNPYHLRLPGWMIDNVRRGSEIVKGKGSEAPSMAYGVLHQLQIYKKGEFKTLKLKSPFLDASADLAQIFKLILEAASGSKTKVK